MVLFLEKDCSDYFQEGITAFPATVKASGKSSNLTIYNAQVESEVLVTTAYPINRLK